MKRFFTGLMNFFIHFIRRILFFLTKIIIALICCLIYIVTYEPGKKKEVTMRKIRRIRRLTNFKLWLWKNFDWYFRFIHDAKYFEKLESRFGNKVNIN